MILVCYVRHPHQTRYEERLGTAQRGGGGTSVRLLYMVLVVHDIFYCV